MKNILISKNNLFSKLHMQFLQHTAFLLSGVLLLCTLSSTPVHASEFSGRQWYLSDIGLESVSEDLRFQTPKPIVIAVIDTGIDVTHPAFTDALWTNEAELQGTEGIDDDGNGYIDDIHGFNVKAGNGNIQDTAGHGTHVSGIIAMKPTSIDDEATGVFPAAKIMTVKAADTTNGFSSANLIKAVNYAVKNHADIINMSVGAGLCSDEFRDCLNKASEKALIVAAAGNSGLPIKEHWMTDGENMFPAVLNQVLGVMASSMGGEKASFSNYDTCLGTELDYELIAPGEGIYSTYIKTKKTNYYSQLSGTSMATPIASAAAGILLGEWYRSFPNNERAWKPVYLKNSLAKGTISTIEYEDSDAGILSFPKLNISAALTYLHTHYIDVSSISEDSVSDNTVSDNSVSDNTTVSGNEGSQDDKEQNDDKQTGGNNEGTPVNTEGGKNNNGNSNTNENQNNSGNGNQVGIGNNGNTTVSDKNRNSEENNNQSTDAKTIFKSKRPTIKKKYLYSKNKNGKKVKNGKVRIIRSISGAKADGYVLYRSNKKKSGYKKINTVKRKNKLTVKTKKNHKHYYYVRAYKIINGRKVLSKRSNIIKM